MGLCIKDGIKFHPIEHSHIKDLPNSYNSLFININQRNCSKLINGVRPI